MQLPDRPVIYEMNTAVFLSELSRRHKRAVTFADVPATAWDAIASLNVDAVWFMGVWQRSPLARQLADDNTELAAVLPDLQPDDILGSAYSIRDYVVDERFGGDAALAAARDELARRGIGLILDYVPNHVALDHPWTIRGADHFITGSEQDLAAQPDAFAERPAGIIARGKDPNYPPWSDVAQLNAFSPALRTSVAGILTKLAGQCDGVRCDMAMLMTNDVFQRTWGERAGPRPAADYWETIISAVRTQHPDFRFIAEVYWDMEQFLLAQGFDFCYDKTLYDTLARGSAVAVRRHLRHTRHYRNQLLYFIENHDEPRAAAALPGAKGQAAAIITSTLPGARLYHEGQFEGRRARLPVHLARRPAEPANTKLAHFYRRLLAATDSLRSNTVQDWQPCSVNTLTTHRVSKRLLAWTWSDSQSHYLTVVNYTAQPASGRMRLPSSWHSTNKPVALLVSPKADVGQLLSRRIIHLEPWGYAVIRFSPPR